MEEQVPELVDVSDNEISSTKDNNRDNNNDNGQGPTTENENEKNENENSRHTHRPVIIMTNLKHLLDK